MEVKLSKLEKAQLAYVEFPQGFKTLQLATVDEMNVPNASYSPYVMIDNNYYVYVSELSEHTKNLMTSGLASVFFVQDESESKHLFVRRRLTYNCDVKEVDRGSDSFASTLDVFAETFAEKFITMIRELEDFHLFRLTPKSGIFVNGFGQAFDTQGEGMTELAHKNDVGHRSTSSKVDDDMEALAE